METWYKLTRPGLNLQYWDKQYTCKYCSSQPIKIKNYANRDHDILRKMLNVAIPTKINLSKCERTMENDDIPIQQSNSNVPEEPKSKSISSLEAKREARRRRILENSSNRLEKITGRPHTEEPVTVTRDNFGEIPLINEIHEDPELERDVYEGPSSITTNAFSNENFNIEADFLQSFFQSPGNNLFTQQSFNFSQQTDPSNTPATSPTVFETVIDTKIHIAIISAIVYVLFATGNQVYTSNNVFLYLLLWELAEMVIIKPRSKTSGSIMFGLASALLLKNVDQKIKTFVSSALNTINKVFKDVAIFMFVFVCIHIGWEYFGSQEPKTFIEILGK